VSQGSACAASGDKDAGGVSAQLTLEKSGMRAMI
jgi:hypothetical protein